MEDLTIVQMWGYVIGLLLPFVLGLLLKHSWANWLKFVIVLVVSAIVGVISLAIAGSLRAASVEDWLLLIGNIAIASQVTFFFFIDRLPKLKAWLYGHFMTDGETQD
jgi:hypothetical protein